MQKGQWNFVMITSHPWTPPTFTLTTSKKVMMNNMNNSQTLNTCCMYVKDRNNNSQCLSIVEDKFSMVARERKTISNI